MHCIVLGIKSDLVLLSHRDKVGYTSNISDTRISTQAYSRRTEVKKPSCNIVC